MKTTTTSIYLCLLTITFLFTYQSTKAQCHIDDWTALNAIYENCNGRNWENDNWDALFKDTDSPKEDCDLKTIRGNSYFGAILTGDRISSLKLLGSNVNNVIPSEIELLIELTYFSLNQTKIVGIPDEIGNLVKLEELYFYLNSQVILPSTIGNLVNLKILTLRSNNIRNIPKEIAFLDNLEILTITDELIREIIPEIGDLESLDRLNVTKNRILTEPLPDNLGSLINLVSLDLSDNRIGGIVPAGFQNMLNVETINLSDNEIIGLAGELGNLPNIRTLYLNNNRITKIPAGLGNSLSLERLDIDNNQLNEISGEFGNCLNLTTLNINNNETLTFLPIGLGNLLNLKTLNLTYNSIVNIPTDFGNLLNLTALNMRNNQITGPIPSELKGLLNLSTLNLENNQITGPLPPELGELANLHNLDLENNKIDGSIPAEFVGLVGINSVILLNNLLTGSIPVEIAILPRLGKFDVRNNQLSGCYPEDLKEKCGVIYTDGNNFEFSFTEFCSSDLGICPSNCTTPLTYIINSTCNNANGITTLTYSFSGGTPTYTITGTKEHTAEEGVIYTQTFATPTGNYFVTATDANNCSVSIMDEYEACECLDETGSCECENNAGLPPEGQGVCFGQSVNVTFNDALVETGSIVAYILHTGNLNEELSRNTTGVFENNGLYPVNTELRVTAIVGPPDNTGFPDLNDECTITSALSASVYFFPKIEGTSTATCNADGTEIDISYSFDGAEPITGDNVSYTVTGDDERDSATFGETYTFTKAGSIGSYTLTCIYDAYGCAETIMDTYDCTPDNNCETVGCTDSAACNYNADACEDDGTCIAQPCNNPGCTDPCADNYKPDADTDDGSCNPYNKTCNQNCTAGAFGGTWDAATCACINESEPINGCTDELATNYNPGANCNDNTCMYEEPTLEYCHIDDWTALKQLYESTNGDNWENNAGWDIVIANLRPNNCDLSLLYGIILNDDGRVETIDLSGNNLIDSIPTELSNLTDLNNINLSDNGLTGEIPSSINDLSQLQNINFSDNNLDGTIPFINFGEILINLTNNNYTTTNIENHVETNGGTSTIIYNTQYFGVEIYVFTKKEGESITLNIPGTPTMEGAQYQWKKNNEIIPDANSATYTIDPVKLADAGIYTLEVSYANSVENLNFISRSVHLFVEGYDENLNPVRNSTDVVYKGSLENLEIEDTYEIVDGCGCDRRELHLLRFETEEAANKFVVKINSDDETQYNRADVDGGGIRNYTFGQNIVEIDEETDIFKFESPVDSNEGYNVTPRIFIPDTGLDHHGDEPTGVFLMNEAPVDTCESLPPTSGFSYIGNGISLNYGDDLGHGTFGFKTIVSGLMGKVDLEVVPIRIFDETGYGSLFDMVCAIYHAVDHGANIICLSSGYRGIEFEALRDAVAYADSKGVIIVTAAGNDGLDLNNAKNYQYPAVYSSTYKNVVTVGSIGAGKQLSEFSNYGDTTVTLVAHGENIEGYSIRKDCVAANGTSISTFLVTQAIALEWAKGIHQNHNDLLNHFYNQVLIEGNDSIKATTITGKYLPTELKIVDKKDACCQSPLVDINIDTTCNSATFKVDLALGRDEFLVEYKLSTKDEWTSNISSDTIFTLEELSAGTYYDIRFSTKCDDADGRFSAVTGPISFITGCQLVDIEDFQLNLVEMQISPNPANDIISIQLNNNLRSYETLNIQITNLIGEIMYDSSNVFSGIYSKQTINTQSFEKGLYLVRLFNDNLDLTQKIIIR